VKPSLDEALRRILAVDAEGNVVVNAEVRWRRFVTGLYDRRCVEVRGDLARTVSTIHAPGAAGHHSQVTREPGGSAVAAPAGVWKERRNTVREGTTRCHRGA
jgi:hypothetical protein